MLGLLRDQGLVQGKTIGIDATTLEASAAMRSIVRRDTGEQYRAFLERLAKDSRIAKMKDGRTHLRTHAKILKRLLVHSAGCNLTLLMRTRFGIG